MKEQDETVKQEETVETQDTSSQSETTETPNEETQTSQEGVEEETGVEKEPVEEKKLPEEAEEEKDETGVPLKNRLAEKERLIEKYKREAEEAKTKPAPFDKEAFLDNYSRQHPNVDKDALREWLPIIQEVSAGIAGASIAPLKQRIARSDYELGKSELKRNPKYAAILADKEIEKKIDAEAAKVPNADWSNPQAMESLTRYVLGDPEIITRLMGKKGARKQSGKTIDAPNALAGGSRAAPAKTGVALTPAEKTMARNMKITDEEYAKYKDK